MKKVLLLLLVLLIGGAGGFLYYDWHVKTKANSTQPTITIYEWTDQQGVRHFTETLPPQEAWGVKISQGRKYIAPPLIYLIQHEAKLSYYRIKDYVTELFSSKSKKRRKKW